MYAYKNREREREAERLESREIDNDISLIVN